VTKPHVFGHYIVYRSKRLNGFANIHHAACYSCDVENHLAAAGSDGPSLKMTKSIIRAIVDELESSKGSDQAMTQSLVLERIRDDLPPSTFFIVIAFSTLRCIAHFAIFYYGWQSTSSRSPTTNASCSTTETGRRKVPETGQKGGLRLYRTRGQNGAHAWGACTSG
jgi:hypothetical protein